MALPTPRWLFCLAAVSFLIGPITVTVAVPGEEQPPHKPHIPFKDRFHLPHPPVPSKHGHPPLVPPLLPPKDNFPPPLGPPLLPPKDEFPPPLPPLGPPPGPPLLPPKDGFPPIPPFLPPKDHFPPLPPIETPSLKGGSLEASHLGLLSKVMQGSDSKKDVLKVEEKIVDETFHRQTQTDTLTVKGSDEQTALQEDTQLGVKEFGVRSRASSGDGSVLCGELCSSCGGIGSMRGAHLCVCELKPNIYKENEHMFPGNKLKARESGLVMVHVLERRVPKSKRVRRCASFRSRDKGPHGVPGLGKQDEIKEKVLLTDLLDKFKTRNAGARSAVQEQIELEQQQALIEDALQEENHNVEPRSLPVEEIEQEGQHMSINGELHDANHQPLVENEFPENPIEMMPVPQP